MVVVQTITVSDRIDPSDICLGQKWPAMEPKVLVYRGCSGRKPDGPVNLLLKVGQSGDQRRWGCGFQSTVYATWEWGIVTKQHGRRYSSVWVPVCRRDKPLESLLSVSPSPDHVQQTLPVPFRKVRTRGEWGPSHGICLALGPTLARHWAGPVDLGLRVEACLRSVARHCGLGQFVYALACLLCLC